ncbi:unnamed protein product [Phytomonas sp. Hart1]|nr:unnamed protein product [Phytomonas sp. Hart1]|eukprot:CCW68354.1 unnamed protein product [Phytomonas sp. isolate Hart1]
MRIEQCSFCGAPIYPGHGRVFARNDCRVFRFCASKCERSFGMRRNPMRTRWTKTFRKAHGKELSIDATMDFERRRDVPVKYNRELLGTTLAVMKRVERVRERRAEDLWQRRMRRARVQDQREATSALHHNIDWIEDLEVKHAARDDLVAMGQEKEAKQTARREAARKRRQRQREVEKASGVGSATSAKKW